MSSFDRPNDPDIAASPWVTRFAPLIRAGGRVLDVAAGHGRHTRHLLGAGYEVTAVDIDTSGLSDLSGSNGLTILEANIEDDGWPFSVNTFDGIVMTNYLYRVHFPFLVEALMADGVLLIETFGAGNEKFGRPRNPDFLLQPGELLSAFAGSLTVVAYEHGAEQVPRPAVRQRLCATKATEPISLT
ncbi:MAG: methyltransferase domain-containing protein [Alphaproteobacteria bacterium]|nr:methyltransferase domain-containing protein [Alphaproteobacteria bacterium]